MLSIDQIKVAVSKVGSKYGIKNAYLFGSYAKGEAREDSDVDLIIDKGDIRGIQLSSFRLELIRELKGTNVDLLTTKSIRHNFLPFIQDDRILIYRA